MDSCIQDLCRIPNGMIPERVETVTSITFKRNKNYQTPVGNFSYFYLDPKRYPSGIRLLEIAPYQSFLIAIKEKALCDFLILRRGKITSHKMIEEILFEDLRMDILSPKPYPGGEMNFLNGS